MLLTVEKTRVAQFDLWTNLSAHTCANLNITSITSSDHLTAASSKMKFVWAFGIATIYFMRGNLLEPSISSFRLCTTCHQTARAFPTDSPDRQLYHNLNWNYTNLLQTRVVFDRKILNFTLFLLVFCDGSPTFSSILFNLVVRIVISTASALKCHPFSF